jgi:hypothetical protein
MEGIVSLTFMIPRFFTYCTVHHGWDVAEWCLPLFNRLASTKMHLPTSSCHALFAWPDSQSQPLTISPRHEINVLGLPDTPSRLSSFRNGIASVACFLVQTLPHRTAFAAVGPRPPCKLPDSALQPHLILSLSASTQKQPPHKLTNVRNPPNR